MDAIKASSSPWEEEDWEGLSYMEIYNMMKDDLVPAQHARLGRKCIEEMEGKVKEEQNLFIKAAAEIATLKSLNSKLEARITFSETAKNETDDKEKELNKIEQNKELISSRKPIVAASKFVTNISGNKAIKEHTNNDTEITEEIIRNNNTSSKNSNKTEKENNEKMQETSFPLGRSRRSASKLSTSLLSSTVPLTESSVPDKKMSKSLNDGNKVNNKPQSALKKEKEVLAAHDDSLIENSKTKGKRYTLEDDDEDIDKRIKVKTTDTDSPARMTRVKQSNLKMNSSSFNTPLSNLTNSPAKVNTPTKKHEGKDEQELIKKHEDQSKENPALLARAYTKSRPKEDKTRNKDECKQQ
jgi:hypothetical protein